MTTLQPNSTWPVLAAAGDQAICISFENEISETVHQKVMALLTAVSQSRQTEGPLSAVTEMVPSYRSLLILYDGLSASFAQMHAALLDLTHDLESVSLPSARIIEIPTVYGGEAGPDLERVANHCGLSPEAVIAAHANKPYLVYMIGFIAGFPYLGGMDSQLAAPRLDAPRKKIPVGSVGIAGAQTGVYPLSTPGGWNLIGQTSLPLFDPNAQSPVRLRAGDRVVFKPVASNAAAPNAAVPIAVGSNIAPGQDPTYSAAPNTNQCLATVIEPGMQTTIQDLGRPGYQDLGISSGGAMDAFALRIGNELVGNPATYPGLEMLMSGPSLRFETDTIVAITGADMEITLNGKPQPLWESIKVKKGDQLHCGFCQKGLRTYLSIAGGIWGDRLFGSCSTALNIGIGGMFGRALRREDALLVFDKEASEKSKKFKSKFYPKSKLPPYYLNGNSLEFPHSPSHSPSRSLGYSPSHTRDHSPNQAPVHTLRVVLGPQLDHFSEGGIETFLNSAYQMSQSSDRMGARLSGSPVKHSEKGADILSDGIAYGAIQVPGDGQPIIMLADRQTIGGYAKIAHVISADHGLLAQLRPGDNIAFKAVSVEEAQLLLRSQDWEVAESRENPTNPETSENPETFENTIPPRHYNITVNGKNFEVVVEEKVK